MAKLPVTEAELIERYWYDFPFNEGKLCPKGVKRYLQGSHPDRLLEPLVRDESQPGGFRAVDWDTALARTVSEIRRIQHTYGNDSFALLSGVSLTNEKSYLIGKFARLALQTANLDYNGRLCMVSAGAGNKVALGADRAPDPWSDIPLADAVFVAGANVAECAPITTSYIWRARDRGAKLIVADPRVTPLARTAEVLLGGKPGIDSALMGPILRILIENEPDDRIIEAARLWGTSETGMLLHGRGIEHHSKGVENVLSCTNLGLATGKFGRPGAGVSTITGQGNGQGGREQGHKCDQLPGNRDVTNPEHRAYVAGVWGCDVDEGCRVPTSESRGHWWSCPVSPREPSTCSANPGDRPGRVPDGGRSAGVGRTSLRQPARVPAVAGVHAGVPDGGGARGGARSRLRARPQRRCAVGGCVRCCGGHQVVRRARLTSRPT